MKRINLNETWKLCLQMWKWIVRQLKAGSRHTVSELKMIWMRTHKFQDTELDCFFCEHDIKNKHLRKNKFRCYCPAERIDKDFDCTDSEYHYLNNAPRFYKKLLRLNKIRLAKKASK